MNGQHSSTMLSGLNGNFPKDLKVHLDTYEVDTPEALAILFRQFDDRKSAAPPAMSPARIRDFMPTCMTCRGRRRNSRLKVWPTTALRSRGCRHRAATIAI